MEITDKINAEANTDFKTIFESVPGLYLVLLPDLTIVAASDAYLSTTLTKRENIIGKYLFDVFPDNPGDATADAVNNTSASMAWVLKYKKMHTMSVQRHDIRQSDGTFLQKYWSPVNKPVLNSNNEVVYIIHRVEDVTDFMVLQKELKTLDKVTGELKVKTFEMESEIFSRSMEIKKLNEELEHKIAERNLQIRDINETILDYKTALDESNIVAITDQNGTIIHVNDNFCKLSKYSREELVGQDHRIINSGYHSKEFIRELWTTITSGNIWRGELKNKAKDGSHYWVSTTIVPFLDKKGKPYKYLAIRSDITEQKLSIEMIKSRKKKYYDLFENSLVPMFISDPETRKTINVNAVGFAFFGYKSRKDFLDHYDSLRHFVDHSDLERMRRDIVEMGIVKRDNVRMKKQDGTVFSAKLVSKLSSDKSFVQTALIDITDQLRSQQELEAKVKERTLKLTNSLLREKELNELKTRFVSFASHEFRTPLSSILSSASLIEMYKSAHQQDEREKHTQRITASVNDLKNILDEFLSFMQLEKGAIDADMVSFHLPDFLGELIEDLYGMVNGKQQIIEYRHEGREMVMQSKKILKHVLLNLLSNASKYSMEGAVIELHSFVVGNQVTVKVKDHGIGIPEADQQKLFTEFFRAGNVKNIQGTGLGLSIVKKYVELLNGSIDFVSKIGEGTTFTLLFSDNAEEQNQYIGQ